MPKQIPVPTELTRPFWDALNEHRLVLQHCSSCDRLRYPPEPTCDRCGSDQYEWQQVEGKGHILEYFVIRDSRIKRLQGDQPLNMALVTLDQDPGLNFLSNLPGTPVGEVRGVRVGDAVLFLPQSGLEIELEGEDYLLLRERDVQAVTAAHGSVAASSNVRWLGTRTTPCSFSKAYSVSMPSMLPPRSEPRYSCTRRPAIQR